MLADYGFRALLRLFPKEIRDAHAAEMRDTFLQVCESRSPIPELVDLATSAVKARAGYPRIPSGREPRRSNSEGGFMSAFTSDVRQASRALLARPGTTAIAVSLLALAIAACTAVFTVADAVIFRPVPYANADRLVPIGIARQPGAWPALNVTPALVRAWRDSGAFERIEAHSSLRGTNLDEGADPRTVPQSWITPGSFDLLGVAPLAGRRFTEADARQIVPPALISETLWRSEFGGDPALIGRRIAIDGKRVEIVGVMPASFRYPLGRRGLWRPLDLDRAAAEKMPIWAVGLLRRGLAREDARQITERATQAVAPDLVKAPASVAFAPALGIRSFDQYTVNTVKVLFGGVALVLLVASVNVANLLLAQALARRRERAVKAALGASRARLIRQALCETAMLSIAAAGAGLFLSWLAVSSYETLLPEYMLQRGANGIDIDARAYGLIVLLTAAVMLVSGLLPAWLGTRVSAGAALKQDARGSSEGRGARRMSNALVVGEIAVTVALLVTAALLVRSFVELATADRGMRTRGLASVWIGLPEYHQPGADARRALADTVQQRLAALPDVEQVVRLRSAPPDGADIYFSALRVDDGRTVEGLEVMGFHATPEFFDFFGMTVVAGRFLSATDPPNAVVVSTGLAQAMWPGHPSPIGRTFRIGSGEVREVVGVTREIRTSLLDPRVDNPELFTLDTSAGGGRFGLRMRDGAAVPVDEIRAAIRSVHPSYLVHEAASIEEQYREQMEGPETAAAVASAFAVFGTTVCAAGLFSVLSLTVARRRREFGIRLAVGGDPSHVAWLVVRQTAWTVGAGIALGAAGALVLARNLSSVLAGVDIGDALSWVAVVATIALAGAAAAWLPVRNARRIDPLLLLREE